MKSPPTHLLDLPLDILTLILELLLIPYGCQDGSDIDSVSSSTSSASSTSDSDANPVKLIIPICPCSLSPIDPLAIFLVHPRIYAVAAPLFYSANQFELDATRRHAAHVKNLLAYSSPLPTILDPLKDHHPPAAARKRTKTTTSWAGERNRLPEALQVRAVLTKADALRKIRRLRVRIDRLRGWIHEDLEPLVRDMILRGELVHLQVDVITPAGSHPQARADTLTLSHGSDEGRRSILYSGLFVRQPIGGLLDLLADPYLLTASLRVDLRHRREWCAWHAAMEGGCLGSREREQKGSSDDNGDAGSVSMWSVLRAKGAVHDDDEEMIEVDWRGLKAMVDPGGEDLAMAVSPRRVLL